MKNDRILADYGIQPGTTILLQIRDTNEGFYNLGGLYAFAIFVVRCPSTLNLTTVLCLNLSWTIQKCFKNGHLFTLFFEFKQTY